MGESRFGQSRFGASRFGTWVEERHPDSAGRASGLYRQGDGPVAELTVVRPPPTPAPVVRPAPEPRSPKSNAPKALSLPGGRRGVLLFHGLSSTPLELQYLARGIHRAGYTVRAAVLEGYSHSLPSASPSGHAQWAEAALAEFDRMRQHCDSLAVGGLCIGSLLSLHVAAQRPQAVSHVLALSTTLRYDGWAAPRSRWLLPLARLMPWFGRIAVKEREPFGLKDERLRAWIAGQMRESGGSDAGAAVLKVRDLLEAQNLMKLVRTGLKDIVAPTLLLHAREDDCASPRSAFEVASTIRSERVNCLLLNDSYHMISIDREKARVLSEMKDFLQGGASDPGAPKSASSSLTSPTETRSPEHVRL